MSRLTSRAGVVALALLSILTASIAVVVAVDSGGGPAVAASTSSSNTISVSGEGTVQGVPDTLIANMSVHSHQSSVQDALNEANSDMSKLKSTLIGKGVPRGDLQTTDLELNPSYDNHGNVNGYDASESLSVRIHPLNDVGTILAAAGNSAGNSVTFDGLSLDISDDSTLVNQARAKAFQQAHDAAAQDASLAGKQLGDVVSIKESQETTTTPQPFYMNSLAATADKASVPISAGKQPVSVTLNVVWSLS
jgi:uncharacterized protein YggE